MSECTSFLLSSGGGRKILGTCWEEGEGGVHDQEDNVTMGLATGHQMAIVMYMDNSHDTNHVSSVGLHRQEEIIKKLKMQNMR